MKPTIAVIVRELGSRRELVVMAVAVAIMIGLLPLLPNIETSEATDVRTIASGVSALALGCLLALLFGATVFGNDLSEGRLGFFFCRPISSFSVWWGRTLAAIVMIWAVELIVLVPSLFGAEPYILASDRSFGWPAIAAYVFAPVTLYLIAHALSVMVRARSAWLFLDLAGAAVAGVFVWVNVKPLIEIGARIALGVVSGAFVAALVLALSIAGAIGVSIGRVDLRRTHRSLSLALWGSLALCVAGITTYGNWLRDFGPSDFVDIDTMSVSPDGAWVEIIGSANGRLDVRHRCLISVSDGRWLRLPDRGRNLVGRVVYSADGSTAMWPDEAGFSEPRVLWWADLGRSDPSPRTTGLGVSRRARLTLSDDGNRLAVLEEGTVSIYELEDERLVTAVRLPEDLRRATIFFPSRDVLRLVARSNEDGGFSLIIASVDAETGTIDRTGRIDGLTERFVVVIDNMLKNLLVWPRSADGHAPIRTVYDASNGSMVHELQTAGFPRFLQDGRLMFISESFAGEVTLAVEPTDGGERIVRSVIDAAHFEVHGEAIQNAVVVSQLADPSDRTRGRRFDVLDVDTGEMEIIGENLRGGISWFPWHPGDAGAVFWYRAFPGSSRLFFDQSGALVRWDPETGDLIHVVGKKDGSK